MTEELERFGQQALRLTERLAMLMRRERVPVNPVTACAFILLAVSVLRRFGVSREGFLTACAHCYDAWEKQEGRPS